MTADGLLDWSDAEIVAVLRATRGSTCDARPRRPRPTRGQAPGMPRLTNGYGEIEFVVTPETFHVLVDHVHDNRRIFTDGREWPTDREPSFLGISIGKWIDTDGDGRYDVLEVETRNMKGPRAFDASGLPLHKDNATIIKERISLDKGDKDL